MTVAELIAALQGMPGETLVLAEGTEYDLEVTSARMSHARKRFERGEYAPAVIIAIDTVSEAYEVIP